MTKRVRKVSNVGTGANIPAREVSIVYEKEKNGDSRVDLDNGIGQTAQRGVADPAVWRTGIERFCEKYRGTNYCANQCTRFSYCGRTL